jgi:hypothetical protein
MLAVVGNEDRAFALCGRGDEHIHCPDGRSLRFELLHGLFCNSDRISAIRDSITVDISEVLLSTTVNSLSVLGIFAILQTLLF